MSTPSAPQAKPVFHTTTLLIVDDNPANLGIVSDYLKISGFRMLVARDGESALEKARHGRPDLILLDVMLPGMDGFETCRQLKADLALRDIPVIFTTALTDALDKVRGFQSGGVDYITKPFQYEEVLARVNLHLALRESQAELEQRVAERTSELQDMVARLEEEIAERQQVEAELNRYRTHLEELVKERTAELVVAKNAAEEAQRSAEAANQAKSAFLANMSHELRSPLNTILGFTRLLQRQTALPPQALKDLGVILRSGEHLLTLINQVLDLSKIEAGRATLNETNLDLYHLLDDLEDMFGYMAEEKGLHLAFDRLPALPRYLWADEVKLRQVLINLLGNALKFTAQGSVTLRVNQVLASSAPARNPRLAFAVTDTGCGIAPKELNTVFEAFVQAAAGQQAKEGTGLGLTISRDFVRLMGGELWLESQLGQGTTVRFEIPAQVIEANQVLPAPPQRRVVALAPDQPVARILVADDRWAARQVLVRLLAPLGFEVREAHNGREALEICAAWPPQFIWMDLRMPALDGREATRRLKAPGPGKPPIIIALSASSYEEERAAILTTGFDDFLRKPFREEDVFGLLHKHLGIRFVYEAEAAPPAPVSELEAATLAALPPAQLVELEQALTQLDAEAIQRALDPIRRQQADLAEALAQQVNNFQYGRILRLIRAARDKTDLGASL